MSQPVVTSALDAPHAPSPRAVGTCPVCGVGRPVPVSDLGDVPVLANELWDSRDEALAAPVGAFNLAVCPSCGLLWNTAFDPSLVDYTQRYENSLHFSATFQTFAERLAQRLAATYRLAGGTVLEVGSGKGEFLDLLCRMSGSTGLGFDPSHGSEDDGPVRLVAGELASDLTTRADLIVCRHVLEHVPDPIGFLNDLHRVAAGGATPLYLEVPNGNHMLEECAVWDLIYEHHTYFTEPALRTALDRGGFSPRRTARSFGGQYLGVDARPRRAAAWVVADLPPGIDDLVSAARRFGLRVRTEIDHWRAAVRAAASRGPVALWGIGSKGVTFLNTVQPPPETVAVDVNPRKHGRFVPGSGHEVVAPAHLRGAGVTTVVVTNQRYVTEVRMSLAALEEGPDVIAL